MAPWKYGDWKKWYDVFLTMRPAHLESNIFSDQAPHGGAKGEEVSAARHASQLGDARNTNLFFLRERVEERVEVPGVAKHCVVQRLHGARHDLHRFLPGLHCAQRRFLPGLHCAHHSQHFHPSRRLDAVFGLRVSVVALNVELKYI